ncbi:hypothetical protein AM501_09940 [Aneurinibacillus migulanus]|uniref:hypothetical protein n=1 Tax=Aneurinibacillus migulanus TaxID=47500 RepID=UPI0005BB8B12|nr:hypothetical protein [Aneurinibacillus migulanus]KIV56465.1 hypothetical protein TS64_09355 [Aneurinibacillus migulanus]KPD08473.1 hypothetical protein AM501_09940 [Aneurinibacillus migulanus]
MEFSNVEIPMIEGLTQIEIAIMLEKYTLLLGMLQYGTAEEKAKAKEEIQAMDPVINRHINMITFDLASQQLGLSEASEGMDLILNKTFCSLE